MMKQLWSLARLLLPGVGFALTCLGAYLVALQTESWDLWKCILAYMLMGLGCLCVLIGVFWTLCHSMKSKIYSRGERTIQVFSIERPNFFLPSYEESQHSHAESSPSALFGAPPPYSTNASEDPDCRLSWERPPRYSHVEHVHHEEE